MTILNSCTEKSDPDILLLSLIKNHDRVHWNIHNINRARELKKEGYLAFIDGFHCGYYEITEKGKKFLEDK